MRNLYYFQLLFFVSFSMMAQVVEIPDPVFKNVLITTPCSNTDIFGNNGVDVDTDNDGEIQLAEALAVNTLDVNSQGLTSIAGIENFTNLTRLVASTNSLGNLDLTPLTLLNTLECYNCGLTDINLNGLINLTGASLGGNLFTSLDFSSTSVSEVEFSSNPNLQYANIKNGVESGCTQLLSDPPSMCSMFMDCPLLTVLCLDEIEYSSISNGSGNIQLTTYCTFVPGGNYNNITGNFTLDSESNGCDENDIPFAGAGIVISDDSQSGTTFTDALGMYHFFTGTGTVTVTPQLENPSYFTVTPPSYDFTFSTLGNTQNADFCITANGLHPDLEVILLPIGGARPGFDCHYQMIVKNNGSAVQSGTATVTFDDAVFDFISASPTSDTQTANSISWNFSNLSPFQTLLYGFTINLNSPMEVPPVNIGDAVNLEAALSTPDLDETPADNVANLAETVVGSFDPNDKAVSEGERIALSQVDDYLHYTVRFQNTGTAAAENVVVKDLLTANVDPSTVQVIAASHPFRTTLTADKVLEFFFEGINLPASVDDEPASHGFVTFKIKPMPSVGLNDEITNRADIYFDFNYPIVTNLVVTTVRELSNEEFESGSLTIYPNPAKDLLNITAANNSEIRSVIIYNMLGQAVKYPPITSGNTAVSTADLPSGTYLVELQSDHGREIKQFIRE